MDSIAVRKARREDASAIARLLGQLGYRVSEAETARRIALFGRHDDTACFVSLDDKENLVGCMQVMLQNRLAEGRYAEVASLVVADVMRGKQVGRRLVARAVDWARDKEAAKVRVRCNIKRGGAHLFYQRLGYTQVKEQKVFECRIL